MKSEINFTVLTSQHLVFAIANQKYFKSKDNFSTIQYSNSACCKTHHLLSKQIYEFLVNLPKGNTYLNFGMGPGFLENIVDIHNNVINLESVEWIDQKENFSRIRRYLDIENTLTYECNSIHDDDFEIYNCNKKYDYILLIRFYPLNEFNSNLDQVKTILNKLKRYSNKAIIFDDMRNYNEDMFNYFNSISDKSTTMSEPKIINL